MKHNKKTVAVFCLIVCLFGFTSIVGVSAAGDNGVFFVYIPYLNRQETPIRTPEPTEEPTPSPSPVPTGVVVLSSNAFVPYEGSTSLYIVGEIQNNTSENASYIK